MTTLKVYQSRLNQLVENKWFTGTIITLIILNAIIVGIETSPSLYKSYQSLFVVADKTLLYLFTLEIILRFLAVPPKTFFSKGWNWFDFIIVGMGHLFAGAHFVTVLRILRVLRVLRAISVIPSLRRLVDALILTIPSMGNIFILMSIFFYIYAVIGTMLFSSVAPEYFGSLSVSLMTLFQIVTLDSWASGIMSSILEIYKWSWIYFISFVLLGTFIIFNLFIGVIVNNVEKANEDDEKKANGEQPTMAELKQELDEIKRLLKDRS